MTTNRFRSLLAATAATMILAAAGARAADAPAPKLSAAVGKPIIAAQKASQTQDWAAMKASLDEAGKITPRTDYDNYVIARLTMMLDANLQDMAGATAAIQTAVASPALPEADKPTMYKLALQFSLQAKQYDKALTYAKALEVIDTKDADSYGSISQAYLLNKDYANAQVAAQKNIDLIVAAGKKPDRDAYLRLLGAQYEGKNQDGVAKTLETMIVNFNNPTDWLDLIDGTIGANGTRDVEYVWLGRLLALSGATVSPTDASIVGQTATKLVLFGDAQAALQQGGSGFPDPTAAANKDKQSMAAQIATGQKANNRYNAKLADALYGYGMYPQAEAAARLAMTQPGATDATEAPMVLGQTLVAEGKYDDAIAAFGQVTGGGPMTPRVVRLWTAYANIKKNPPSTAPAAAAAAK